MESRSKKLRNAELGDHIVYPHFEITQTFETFLIWDILIKNAGKKTETVWQRRHWWFRGQDYMSLDAITSSQGS